ncbi:hypothetical protein B0J15DRAFT_581914 [Fusarium solani]|uniref:F-box domain-containing protein n=1 Tax=Fusarium solani TaxID=169388 RepID=A0A9P9KJZ8_FUSSL|nr:uncharacterized protein B0J15DRAFT_581914 [Fusarium solani]KAH7259886.1 hypothetical protein B0J15DRAFT_581914 [Fusarium solani]
MHVQSKYEMHFPFLRLPREIQDEIIKYLLPAMVLPTTEELPCYKDKWGFPGTLERIEHKNCAYLRDSCKQIRNIVDRIRPIRSTRGFRFDPKRDTLKVWEMTIPDSDPYGDGHWDWSIPARKLLTVFPSARNPINGESTGVSDPIWDEDDNFDMEFDMDTLSEYFPMIEEITLVIQSAGWEWHIDGFQMYGPDVVDRRHFNDDWGRARVGNLRDRDAEDHFMTRGIRGSTPYRWKGCGSNFFDLLDMQTIEPTRLSWYAPYIGFYGYSRGTYSMGGNWPGFRYYTDTKEVEFSPLSFSEISFATDRQDTPKREPEGGRDAQLVSRVWIIRPGRPAPPVEPHHCWVKMEEWEEGDPDWIWQVANTWKMVSVMLSSYNIDNKHGLHLKEYESIVSSENWQL